MDVYTRKLKSHQKGLWDSIDTNTSNSGFLEFLLLHYWINSGFGINEVRYYREIMVSAPQTISEEKNLRSILWEASLIIPPKTRVEYLKSLDAQIERYDKKGSGITEDCSRTVMEITNQANLSYLRRKQEETKAGKEKTQGNL